MIQTSTKKSLPPEIYYLPAIHLVVLHIHTKCQLINFNIIPSICSLDMIKNALRKIPSESGFHQVHATGALFNQAIIAAHIHTRIWARTDVPCNVPFHNACIPWIGMLTDKWPGWRVEYSSQSIRHLFPFIFTSNSTAVCGISTHEQINLPFCFYDAIYQCTMQNFGNGYLI